MEIKRLQISPVFLAHDQWRKCQQCSAKVYTASCLREVRADGYNYTACHICTAKLLADTLDVDVVIDVVIVKNN